MKKETMRFLILTLLAGLGAFGGLSHAQVSYYNPTWAQARVLSVGQSLFSFRAQYRQSDSRFSYVGDEEPLGQRYSRAYSWNQALGATGPKDPLGQYLKSHGIEGDETVAWTDYQVERTSLRLEGLWSYGLLDGWMIGARIPFVVSETEVSAQTNYSKSYQRLMNQVTQHERNEREFTKIIRQKMDRLAEQQVSRQGFDPLEEEFRTYHIGDVELMSQLEVTEWQEGLVSVRQRMVFPGARGRDPYEYVDNSAGDGQTDLGFDALMDWHPRAGWLLSGRFGYTFQLPDTISARVPVYEQSSYASEIDRDVSRDLGDIFLADLNGQYRMSPVWTLNGGYHFQKKAQDVFSGESFKESSYEAMSRGTERSLHVARLGMTLALEPSRIRRDVRQQFQTSLNHYIVLAGQNVANDSLTSLDLILYY